MRIRIKYFLILIMMCCTNIAGASIDIKLEWNELDSDTIDISSDRLLSFNTSTASEEFGLLPGYYRSILLKGTNYSSKMFSVSLLNEEWESFDGNFAGMDSVKNDAIVKHFVSVSRKEYFLDIVVIPIRRNGNGFERLKSFSISYSQKPVTRSKSVKAGSHFKSESVLASGKWFKVAISETGMHKLSYSDISSMGLNPETVRIYGGGKGVLDNFISNYDSDDLRPVKLWVEKGSDNVFNTGDYILFYAHGPHSWRWNDNRKEFVHIQHPFSNESYYYLTSDNGSTDVMITRDDIITEVNDTATYFYDYAFYEPMEENLLESGAEWYSEKMDQGTSYTHNFSFNNLQNSSDSKITVAYAARSTQALSTVTVNVNGNILGNITIPGASSSSIGVYAYERTLTRTFQAQTDNINVKLDFANSTDPSASGWLNYVRLNTKKETIMRGDELQFRYPETIGVGKAVRFDINEINDKTKVIDVTDPNNAELLTVYKDGNSLFFKDDAEIVREYVAFKTDGSFPKPKIVGVVENQNLHALDPVDMVILSHKDFTGVGMAKDLYDLHTNEGLSVVMVTPEEIYNEFSAGKPDVTAIRWFLKSLYDKATGEDDLLKYLLVFGDGTFDNRPEEDNDRSRIITYQSGESLHQANTYVSDDYFALLDDSEGGMGNADKVDIGVGRYPVHTEHEARTMVIKTKYYLQNRSRSMWKNTVCFVADDGDSNIHMRDANLMADKVASQHPEMIIDKILLDAYQQVIEASGPSYPDANKAFQSNLQKGVLLLNYSGHGGVTGLTDEKIITKNIISNFSNLNNLPVWVTATCEFSRFDLDKNTSAGEMVLLSEQGGGVSLFTTTRVVFSSSNYTINNNFFDYAFKQDENGIPLRLGDICRETKSHTGTGANKRKFMLLGNPALAMVMPELKVKTSSIAGNSNFDSERDTFSALEPVTVHGYIEDHDGDTAKYFNGEVIIKVYDKKSTITTLMNDAGDYTRPLTFELWDKTIFNGVANVVNGKFVFQFMVPKEINYEIGNGRIVYYATSDVAEAKGYSEELIIGGFNDDFAIDDAGPEVNVYLNSLGFTNGATVNPNPLFIADISDLSGINTSGVGIGHDIVLMLNDDPLQTYVLNDFYFPVDGFSKGQVRFKLENLPEGEHTLFFRVWDIYNNSGSKEITFVVSRNDGPDIAGVTCYPNPAVDEVYFEFFHNRPETVMDVLIDIYSTNGQLINRLNEKLYSVGSTIDPVRWDLTDATGRKVNRGVYFYKVRISQDGKVSEGKAQKLIVN